MIKIRDGLLYQWDLNRMIEIDDPEGRICEVHCCRSDDNEALVLPFTRKENKLEAFVPNIFLQSAGKLYFFTVTDIDGEIKTAQYRSFRVFYRQRPADYVYEETEVLTYRNLERELKDITEDKADLDESRKLRQEQLPDNILMDDELASALNEALAVAKESGEFKGEKGDRGEKGAQGVRGADGYTPVKGIDYFTASDKKEITDEVISSAVTQNTGDSTDKVMSQKAVTSAIERLVTLPYGGSKEWLERNGDTSKLYQIGGYVWGFIESDGWTKSETSFLVVTGEEQMVNIGGTAYLLRSGNVGTVYVYKEASGDIGVTEYASLPESANEGDIVAVGGRRYKASLTSRQVPNWTKNYANPANTAEWLHDTRLNSSNTTGCTGMTTTNYIDTSEGDVVRVANFDMDTKVSGADPAVSVYNQGNKSATTNRNPTRSHTAFVSEKNGVYTFSGVSGYLRFCGTPVGGDSNVIITVNEEIAYRTETQVSWSDIGAYTPPVEAGWYATDESYTVTDSLSSAVGGQTVVYSGDGYVYSYIGGADWVQTCRYISPTLSVDGELSDSSENAVQNKRVTEAINELKVKTAVNSDELTAVNERIAGITVGGASAEIPSFWQSAVEEAVAKIKALQTGKHCVTFPFFTDNHQRNGYAGILISHIMKQCGMPYAFFGGDTISSGYLNEEEMLQQDKAFDTAMSYIPEGCFCRAVGNHDGFWNDNGSRNWYTRDKIYELFLRGEGVAQNKHFGEDGTYYYVDDTVSKVRFIVLNTNGLSVSAGSEGVDDTQLSWLRDSALCLDSEWGAVIISHCPVSNHYHANVTNAAEVISAVNNSGADIIGWYSGHIHRDRIYTHSAEGSADEVEGIDTAPLGFTEVTVTSDHTAIAYEDTTKHPIGNDALSHAIDFVTVNKKMRTVNITRLGIGTDRSYTY